MRADWSQLKARISNRLARHFRAAPLRLPGDAPMVSFTFDDVPKSAAIVGATILEEYGVRATLYVAGSLVGQWSGLRAGIDADEIIGLHRNGHEIACHTFSHRRATELDAAAMEAEIEQNGGRLDSVRKLRVSLRSWRKGQLGNAFRSSRGILPGVNSDLVDLHFLRATPLIDEDIDTSGVERAFDQAAASGGWLIFNGHDVAAEPSRYGCTPQLLRHALKAASQRDIPIVSVAEALRRAGA